MAWHKLLLTVLNMSMTASVVTVAVLFARLMLRRAPKAFSYALWAPVLFRLLCPVALPSRFSLLGLFDVPVTRAGGIEHAALGMADVPVEVAGAVAAGGLPGGGRQIIADPLAASVPVLAYVWLAGMAVVLLCSAVQLILLRRKLVGAVTLRDNIRLADHIDTPFIMGVLRPKIYLPSALPQDERACIILHEARHIRRGDHALRLIAFAALCVHWFNPLVWAAFALSRRDMEMSCDEAVVKTMGGDDRAAYSALILRFAGGGRRIAGTAVCFGGNDTKGRVKHIMKYKKPAIWMSVLAAAVCLVLGACSLTNPDEAVLPADDDGENGPNTEMHVPVDGEIYTLRIDSAEELSQEAVVVLVRQAHEDGRAVLHVQGAERTADGALYFAIEEQD